MEPDVNLLRLAAGRLREKGGAAILADAGDLVASCLDHAADAYRRELPSWRALEQRGQLKRPIVELADRRYGPSFALARAVVTGLVEPFTATDRAAIADRDAEILRLREALGTVREAIRNDHPKESPLAVIARALHDPDAPVFVNSRLRTRLAKAEACEKTVYLTRGEALRAKNEVRERHGNDQRPYLCNHCRLWHLTSQLRDEDSTGQTSEATP